MSDESDENRGDEPAATAPAQAPSPEGQPDHSILLHNRLVAYVWARAEGGVLARAGGGAPICPLPFADVRTFDAHAEPALAEIGAKSKTLDAYLFKLGMEGFEISAGAAKPSAQLRRF